MNSKKNNYGQKKIDKYQQFIEDKTAKYLQQLDKVDQQENQTEAHQIQKEKIAEGLVKLKERSIKYHSLQQQLDASAPCYPNASSTAASTRMRWT